MFRTHAVLVICVLAIAPAIGQTARDGGPPDPDTFFEGLDKDEDGKIQKSEATSDQRLLWHEMDSDGDGSLDAEEQEVAKQGLRFRQSRGATRDPRDRRPGGPAGARRGGPPDRFPGGFPGPPGGPPGFPNPDTFFEGLDQNDDGKIDKSEANEQQRLRWDRMDQDGDGFLDQAEQERVRQRLRLMSRRGGPPGGLGGGPGSFDRGPDRFGGGESESGPGNFGPGNFGPGDFGPGDFGPGPRRGPPPPFGRPGRPSADGSSSEEVAREGTPADRFPPPRPSAARERPGRPPSNEPRPDEPRPYEPRPYEPRPDRARSGGPPGLPPRTPHPDPVGRIMSLDKNNDNKLSPNELGSRFSSLISRADSDGDGAVSRDEVSNLVGNR